MQNKVVDLSPKVASRWPNLEAGTLFRFRTSDREDAIYMVTTDGSYVHLKTGAIFDTSTQTPVDIVTSVRIDRP